MLVQTYIYSVVWNGDFEICMEVKYSILGIFLCFAKRSRNYSTIPAAYLLSNRIDASMQIPAKSNSVGTCQENHGNYPEVLLTKLILCKGNGEYEVDMKNGPGNKHYFKIALFSLSLWSYSEVLCVHSRVGTHGCRQFGS